VEVVFHIAALRSVSRSVDDPPMTMECNVTGTTNLLHEAASAGVSRVVYASSSSVYGSAGTGPQREDDRPNPQSPYAVSKLAGEQLCRVWTEMTGIATVSLRYFNVFGPGQPADSKYATVFPAFISALLAGRAPNVEWDGEQTRDFTYITDVIDATVRAGALGSPSSLVLNVSSGAPRSINNVLRAVGDALGVHIPPVYSPRRTGDVRATHGDNRLADEVLGWTPRASWSDAVAATVGWFRSAMNDDDVEFAI
jgi:nucleoside-diphosphate-sugar epimerase